jgi:uncharacterized protein YfaS (alpha-2-macroglobulin family)
MLKHLHKITNFLIIFLMVISLATGCGPVTPIANPATIEAATQKAVATADVNVSDESDVDQEVWLDSSVNVLQFSPSENFVVHFNSPVSPESSVTPVLVWPHVEGISSWSEDHTLLTFDPETSLDGKKTYTFFLDPALRFEDGSALNSSAKWSLYVKSAPRVVSVTPAAGAVDNLFKTVQINFDKEIVAGDARAAVNIAPPVPFDAEWKSEKVLIITLKSPLSANQRYDLTLKAGEFVAKDGSILSDDYNWFYWQKPFEVNAVVTGEKSVQFDFSYKVDIKKTEFPFEISPSLTGEWTWMSPQKLLFVSNEPILSATEYTLSNTASLTSLDGFEMEDIPEPIFSGKPPIKLVMAGFKKSDYGIYLDKFDIEAIRIEFQTSVDHASAEAAFSITPAIAGTFQWEKVGNTTKEILVYKLDELFAKQHTSYRISIDSTVTDSAGKRIMIQPFNVDFGSGYGYLIPSFGEAGDNIQVVNANGPRRIQIFGNDPNISFSAYRFDLSDYVMLYENYYHYRRYDANPRDIPIPDDLNPTLTWYSAIEREVTDDQSVVETIVPPELLPGLYVVNMKVKDRLYDQLFVVVSENTLVIKNDGDDLYVWVTNINGVAVANVAVCVYSKTGEKIREGVTNENGEYRVSIPANEQISLVSAFVKVPGRPNDAIVTGVDSTWSAYFPYDYDEWQSERELPEGKPYLAYIYTERPLYRPGQTVNFKILLRKDDDVKYSLLDAGTLVNVRVKDARGNNVNSFELMLNEFGTVNGSVDISSEAMLGLYTIEAEVNGIISEESFKVEDYRKPDYKVTLTNLQLEKKSHYVEGEEVNIKIRSEYYFGEPLPDAKVEVDFFSGSAWQPLNKNYPVKLTADENGDILLVFKAPYDRYYYSSWYWGASERMRPITVQVKVSDGSNQIVTASQTLFVHPSSEELSLDTGGYFQAPNQPFPVTVTSSTLAGEPVEDRDISLVIYKWNSKEYEFDTKLDAIKMETNDQGQVTQEVTLTSGYYKLSLFSEDSDGRKMEYSRWIYIFKDKNDWVFTSRENRIQITAEKDSYKPYEKARFMIESSFSGPALITFERGSVINSKFIELTAPLTILETDIIPEHAPNVYVTINAWQPATEDVLRESYWWGGTLADSYLRVDRTQILVDATGKELGVEIKTDKRIYEPGEKVTATIRVTDAQGNPAVAELSLAVVDEAIFGLVNPFEANIFTAFYGPREHTVGTFDSMEPTRYIPGGMGGGGDEGPPETRQDFLDTSAWLPVIRTDENGQGIVTFDLPDNTTSWRLTVKAVTLNHQVGEAKTNIETKKEVFLRPVLPRVLTRGDKALLTSFIHNYSEVEKTLTVELQADGLTLEGDANQTVLLKPGEVLPLGWRVMVDRATPTSFKVIARDGDKVLDAVEMPVLIQPAAVLDVQNQSGEFSGTLALPLILPDVDMETSQVTLSLNQSVSGTLLNGLDYLIGYPYGCVEQTMSRALPNAVVARASEQLGVGGPDLSERLDPYIQASITKLYSLQHSDGGWGWWLYDSSTEYQTAWVLFGLGLIERAGYEVEPKVIDAAVQNLNYHFYNRDNDPRTTAFILYSLAMAGRGNLEETQKLVDASINELDPFSQAVLASALNQLGETEQAGEILSLLSQSALEKNGEVYWPQPTHDGEYNSKTMSSTTRTTAMVLLAFAEIEPQHELIPGMVKYLAAQREGMYGWGTTNETTFAILALTQYLISQENTVEPTPYQVNVNGNELFTGILEAGNTSVQLQIPISELTAGANSILVSTQGGRPIYFDLSTKYDLLQDRVDAAGSIKVTRQYLDVETKKIITSFVPGQLVKVQVIVQLPENVYFFAIEDHLPGGLEALNEGLGFSNIYDPYAWQYNSWGDFGYNYKEIRGDRVVFFISELEKGKHTFTYYARATTAGEFLALPVQAYAMYDLDLWGRSESIEIMVR